MKTFSSRLQDKFNETILPAPPSDPLDLAVWWIQDNLMPEDVFTTDQLEAWAFDAGFKKFE